MKRELTAKSAILVVLLYPVASIAASLMAAIVLGGIRNTSTDTLIDGVIDSGMVANLTVLAGVLFISIWVFQESRRDIYFERVPFSLSRWYFLYPLAWIAVTGYAFTQVDFGAYTARVILLVVVASFAIGANEEIVTRGILLVGLRNSGVTEWVVCLITVTAFSLLHLVNVLGGINLTILLVTASGGTILYVSRRVFGNLLVPIGMHALYDTAFYLFTGAYLVGESLPDHVLDIQFGAFLALLAATVLFLIFGRSLLSMESMGSV